MDDGLYSTCIFYAHRFLLTRNRTYKTKKHGYDTNDDLSESIEKYNEELFEQFKQFIQFQKRIEDN